MQGMLTAAQQDVVMRVAQMTRDRLAPRAAHYDGTGTHPVESWRDLGAEGFLAMAIPQEYGAMGLDMPTRGRNAGVLRLRWAYAPGR